MCARRRTRGSSCGGAGGWQRWAPSRTRSLSTPSLPQQRTEHPERHALAFAIPNDTPGLKFVCRESFDYGRSHFDHPLGSRFEEMDATVFFHDVLIPWERVFLYGDVDQCDRLTRDTSFLAHGDHQAVMRQIVKSEFLLGLASLMTQTLGNDDQPHVQERLGELIMYLEVMKGGLRAAEVEAKVDQWGVLTPSYDKLASVRTLYARIFNPRMIEVIQLLGSSSLMALPSQADFESASPACPRPIHGYGYSQGHRQGSPVPPRMGRVL